MYQPSSSSNTEIREYSRRLDRDINGSLYYGPFYPVAFYRNSFRPQIFTDSGDHREIEMKIDLPSYEPNTIQFSLDGNDLIIQAEQQNNHPLPSSSRASFYKRITLPGNTDLTNIKTQHSTDGQFHITATLFEEAH
ncbi:unnamed protein product [Adineta steineri]|uniref:SHSP domain-containing protein n=1 Tax=Adineta steineri TaxID=433720 RepID=A0A819RMN5_9BILA|nr:unnamed protein product [Adineta steineri]CAF3982366.1 unnamed protein product [Adineta steineri]CAF4049659.1 unnamed protein product [Adineta steineri]